MTIMDLAEVLSTVSKALTNKADVGDESHGLRGQLFSLGAGATFSNICWLFLG